MKVTGCNELSTNDQGLTQFLVDAGDGKDISIDGATVWSGASPELKGQEVFRRKGAGYMRA